jgi:hypothetical protein
MYKLNSKSIHAKIFTWLYKTETTSFKTMCPYFWAWVATITFLPFVLLAKFIIICLPTKSKMAKFYKLKSRTPISDKRQAVYDKISTIAKWVIIGLYGSIILIFIGLVIKYIVDNPNHAYFDLFGRFCMVCIVVYLFFVVASKYKLAQKIVKPFVFIGNMIKDLYNNVCPLVIWDEERK